MKRKLISNLLNWKEKKGRKPLLLMGVRQVGKTHLLKTFGQEAFSAVHYINFESDATVRSLFERDLDPQRIITELELYLHITIDKRHSVLIFDEIQACPPALTSLKYFNEQLPELALCAAGSLLGVHLNDTSFPVGQVDMLDLHPMDFFEFLAALDEQQLLVLIDEHGLTSSLPDIAHQQLWRLWKYYLIVGGLPEVVALFVQMRTNLVGAFIAVRDKQAELVKAYHADIAKHAGKVNAMHIARVWEHVGIQLSETQDTNAKRFYFKGVVPGIDRYDRLASAIDWLTAANLIIKVPVVAKVQQPLKAYTKASFFKLFIFDVGILGAMIELAPEIINQYEYGHYKGYFAENFVAQALQLDREKTLYSWQSQKSEVEFLKQYRGHIIPLEVKAGQSVKAKSLQKYRDQYAPIASVILSGKTLYFDAKTGAHQYPIYLASRLPWGEFFKEATTE